MTKYIQIEKVEGLFYNKIYFIFIILVEFCYLFSYDAKNIILNTWEKFLRIWVVAKGWFVSGWRATSNSALRPRAKKLWRLWDQAV